MAWLAAGIALLIALYEFGQTNTGQVATETLGLDFSGIAAPGDSDVSIPVPKTLNTAKASGVNLVNLQAFAEGVWKTEGTASSDLNQRNNNPGNLKFAGQPGAVAGPNNFAVFDSIDSGWAALQRQLLKYATTNPNWTLLQTMRHYLGMDPNGGINVTDQGNALTKAQTVAGTIGGGVDENTTLSQILGV
jgi:hypothetical protein